MIGMPAFSAAGQNQSVVPSVSHLACAPAMFSRMPRTAGCSRQVGSRRASRLTKPVAGHYAKVSVPPGEALFEFRLGADAPELKTGAEIKVDLFSAGQVVDVSGTTIGKGFAGAIKRHHFSSNRATHGNSVSTNAPGSIGMRQDPGRVMPGKRMAGHLGDAQRTTQNLVVARVDSERSLLLIRGAVPGARGGRVVVRPAVKG